MQIHGPSHIHGPQPVNPPHRAAAAAPSAAPESAQPLDQLDISREADLVSRVRDLPEIRAERVEQLRAQIEAGRYETEDKLDMAVSRLLDELGR
jgi:negative regulator of flagellin synthesis FlgM